MWSLHLVGAAQVTGAHVLQMLSHPSPELSPAFGFVCDVFSGNSYAALVAAKHRYGSACRGRGAGGTSTNLGELILCRVYGPLWIEFCAKTGQSLPRCNHPLFAPTMHNLVVCCTSLMNREVGGVCVPPVLSACSLLLVHGGTDLWYAQYIHKRVELMGGTVERGFTKEVTHLIAGDSRSEKYKVGWAVYWG